MILHLANDFSGSRVYKNLFTSLDKLEVTQTVYTAVRSKNLIDKNKVSFQQPQSKIIYSNILNTYSRLNFFYKQKIILKDIQKNIQNLSEFNVMHAHTWYSDGAVAFQLYKKFKIPYIVTIRNTDLNLFFKYMYHLRGLGIKILQNAKKIIFISPKYEERFKNNSYINAKYPEFKSKSLVIPNGISNFWIENVKDKKSKINTPISLLFIGNFSKNKNVELLIKAVEKLNTNKKNYILHLIGGGKDNGKIENKIKNIDFVNFHGPIYDLNKLKSFINTCDIFVMPSHSETFGLVYIEALSQGIPIVYTQGEGIDGFYDNNIGESVNSKDVYSISKGIEKISCDYSSYTFNPSEIVQNHNWTSIAKKYNKTYKKIKQST